MNQDPQGTVIHCELVGEVWSLVPCGFRSKRRSKEMGRWTGSRSRDAVRRHFSPDRKAERRQVWAEGGACAGRGPARSAPWEWVAVGLGMQKGRGLHPSPQPAGTGPLSWWAVFLESPVALGTVRCPPGQVCGVEQVASQRAAPATSRHLRAGYWGGSGAWGHSSSCSHGLVTPAALWVGEREGEAKEEGEVGGG